MTSTKHIMNRGYLMAKRLLRWSVGGLSLLLAMVILFLGGYWIGWKNESRGVSFADRTQPGNPAMPSNQDQSATEPVPMAAEAPELTSRLEVQEAVEDRVVRLAKWLVSGRDARAGSARVTAEIAGMSLTEAWEALEELHHVPDTAAVANLRAKLLLRWAAFDPAGAFDYWRGSAKSLRWPDPLSYQFLDRWAKVNAMEALAGWKALVAENGIPEHEQGYSLRRIFARMAGQDFHLAAQQARQINEPHRENALRGLAELAFRPEHRAQVLGEITAWPPGQARNEAVAAAVASWAGAGELDQAMSWLDQSGVDEATRFSIVEDIGMRRFQDDYEEGAGWLLAQVRTPEQRSRVLADLVVNWMNYDVVQAGQWLVAQNLDESASRAMQVYANKLTSDFPERALGWALSIPDADQRQKALVQVEERLRERHPQRADGLLQSLITSGSDPSFRGRKRAAETIINVN